MRHTAAQEGVESGGNYDAEPGMAIGHDQGVGRAECRLGLPGGRDRLLPASIAGVTRNSITAALSQRGLHPDRPVSLLASNLVSLDGIDLEPLCVNQLRTTVWRIH